MNDGLNLEKKTIEILRIISGAEIEHNKKILEKNVDAYCVIKDRLRPDFRIAIECKDYNRKLNRKQCSIIIAEYLQLLHANLIDQFLLITSNGIIASAKELFNNKDIKHSTYIDLIDSVLDPSALIENMINQFSDNKLNKYYINQKVFSPKISYISKNYGLVYNEYIDFAIENNLFDYDDFIVEWNSYDLDNNNKIPEKINKNTFMELLGSRYEYLCLNTKNSQSIDCVLDEWLSNDSKYSLSILGTYGTGKSCLAKYIANKYANEYKNQTFHRIPLLIELKDFGSHQDVQGLITHELVNKHRVSNGSYELFKTLNEAGKFLIILDGFDEMKQGMTYDSLLYNFYQLSKLQQGKSKTIICGRPTLFDNQQEQSKILSNVGNILEIESAQYIQIQICPFDLNEVYVFLRRYNKIIKSLENIELFIQELKDEANANFELEQLISRPVHLPMLLHVIPRKKIKPKNLNRAVLYREFISAIIEREMLKRRSEFQNLYSSDSRRDFSKIIAVEMLKKGESRSYRTSELKQSLLSKFHRPGVPFEAIKRDLVSTCFLERKPPDILYIQHKSFLEYLAAEYILEKIKSETPSTDNIGFIISTEIFSFVQEISSKEDVLKLLDFIKENKNLLLQFFQFFSRKKLSITPYLNKVIDNFDYMPNKVKELFIIYFEENPKTINSKIYNILEDCLQIKDIVISVHAYRAIIKSNRKYEYRSLLDKIGFQRVLEWDKEDFLTKIYGFSENENISVNFKKVREEVDDYIKRYLIGSLILNIIKSK